jgi:hypothetical protein
MGSRVLWPRIPPAPAKAFEKKGVGQLSCVEAALWVEERWQAATGTAGATTCTCDAAGNIILVVMDTSSTFFFVHHAAGEVLFQLIDLFCVSVSVQEYVPFLFNFNTITRVDVVAPSGM